MDPLNATNSSPCTLHLSSLACLTLVRSDRLPSCSLWHQCYSLAVAFSSHSSAICLSQSVDSSALSYTARRPSSHRTLKSLSTFANLKCVFVPSFPFIQFKFSVYGHTYADRHTYTSCNAVPVVWGLFRLAPISYKSLHRSQH